MVGEVGVMCDLRCGVSFISCSAESRVEKYHKVSI